MIGSDLRSFVHCPVGLSLFGLANINIIASQSCTRSANSQIFNQLFQMTNPFKAQSFDEQGEAGLTFTEADQKMRQWQLQVKTKRDINRIVNGYDTPAGEAPYYVRIVSCNSQGSCSTCGASWISQTKILTAAHCISSDTTDMYYYLNPESNAQVGDQGPAK